MNTRYKILWIDDNPDFIETTKELIEDTVQNNRMAPELAVYSQYEDYQKKELEHFDEDIFNLYDQIVVDYALSGTTGDIIINDLRRRNIFTDIVFYSSNYETMQEELKKSNLLDGVFFSSRENLTSAIDKVIKKNLKREYSIANIRGLIMDSTSEFDYICRTTTLALFAKLPAGKQKLVLDKAKEYVSSARGTSNRAFDDLEKKDGLKFLQKAMESVEYVMSNKDRYAIMALVVREFDDNPVYGENFSEAYKDELISPRNDLAHNKLFYGDCQKKIHIAKKKQVLKCDKNCSACKSKYSIETCEKLRERIFYYHNLFDSLDRKYDELV